MLLTGNIRYENNAFEQAGYSGLLCNGGASLTSIRYRSNGRNYSSLHSGNANAVFGQVAGVNYVDRDDDGFFYTIHPSNIQYTAAVSNSISNAELTELIGTSVRVSMNWAGASLRSDKSGLIKTILTDYYNSL